MSPEGSLNRVVARELRLPCDLSPYLGQNAGEPSPSVGPEDSAIVCHQAAVRGAFPPRVPIALQAIEESSAPEVEAPCRAASDLSDRAIVVLELDAPWPLIGARPGGKVEIAASRGVG